CYDKELESAGEIRAVCWELESSGEKARKRFDDILEAVRWARSEHEDQVSAMAKTIGQHIGGAIDFIDRSAGDKNLARCPRLDFWTKILAKLGGRLTWVTEHVQKTVDRAKTYIYNQVVPSLAMLHEALTPERFWSWLEKTTLDGLDRLRAVHHRAIAAYKVDEAAGLAYTGDMLPMFDAFRRENAPPPLTPEEMERFCL
ncbi:MAG TPA: hypothetical protein ENO14_00385, partial [Chromatiales bacterium]|nr:hypothetical protein [Chromatiales bacterium]